MSDAGTSATSLPEDDDGSGGELEEGGGPEGFGYERDPYGEYLIENQTVTNDAVAGETILPGAGEDGEGPTGGSPGEAQPLYEEPDDDDEGDIDLRDEDE